RVLFRSVLFSGMTVCVKFLGQAIPIGQTIFVRGLISAAVLALIAWRSGALHLLKTDNWRSHALRSVSGTVSMFCLFAAVTMIPLADVTAITFTSRSEEHTFELQSRENLAC